jgi:uncharacterized protein (DUF433 family)
MFVETRYEHVTLDEHSVAFIAGTTMKVKELVAERLAWGWSPEELLINHPYLTMGQIFSALAYYSDHQSEIDNSIAADIEHSQTLKENTKPSPLIARLKAQGLI